LALGAATLFGLAGCTGDEPSTDDSTTEPTSTDDVPTTAEGATELDLREANVVGATADRRDGEVRFDVTLHHDDDGEDGYANWWQVETLEGERLGRRDLLHAHGTREFTRSATVDVPGSVDCVVVRGHDRTHGYGGRAMLVNVTTDAVRAVGQGSERQPMADRTCP
jgi:hypothetical protein